MGEIADMMIDGDLCEGCGVAFDDEGQGFPRRCKECGPYDYQVAKKSAPPAPSSKKTNCPECGKRVKKIGLPQHIQDIHGK